jgi:hypothetical protein
MLRRRRRSMGIGRGGLGARELGGVGALDALEAGDAWEAGYGWEDGGMGGWRIEGWRIEGWRDERDCFDNQ